MATYGFLTSDSAIIEVKASNAKQAYKKAILKNEKLRKKLKKLGWGSGKVTKSYFTYNKQGFAPTGIYKTLK